MLLGDRLGLATWIDAVLIVAAAIVLTAMEKHESEPLVARSCAEPENNLKKTPFSVGYSPLRRFVHPPVTKAS